MNDKLKYYFNYVGFAGAVISALAYMIMTYVIVMGFETSIDRDKQILFAILGAIVGMMINSFLRGQGVTFAKKEPESITVMKEYNNLLNKKKPLKKLKTINFYIFVQTIKDIFIKGITIAITTYYIMYIFMEGSENYSLFVLAISNIFMFAGLGLMALSKAYDHYIESHIPVIKERIIKLNDQAGSVQSEGGNNGNI